MAKYLIHSLPSHLSFHHNQSSSRLPPFPHIKSSPNLNPLTILKKSSLSPSNLKPIKPSTPRRPHQANYSKKRSSSPYQYSHQMKSTCSKTFLLINQRKQQSTTSFHVLILIHVNTVNAAWRMPQCILIAYVNRDIQDLSVIFRVSRIRII